MIITIDTEKSISTLDLDLLRVIVQHSGPVKAATEAAAGENAATGQARWVTDPEEPGAVIMETAAPAAEADQENYGADEEKINPEKPKRKRRTKAEMEAARAAEAAAEAEQDEPVQEAAPEPEAVSEAPEPASEATDTSTIGKFRDEAVAKATEMVASGGRDKVVEALAAVGAKKVSQIADDKLAEFVGLLKS